MEDGLYRVETKHICAGFVVKNDKITKCAPILRKKIKYWIITAKKVEINNIENSIW